MKKLLFVAILGTLVACGESSSTTPATDSTVTVDSATATVDTAAAAVDTTKADSATADSAK